MSEMAITKKQKRYRKWLVACIIIFIYIWAFAGMPKVEINDTSGEVVSSIISGLIHPDWDYVYDPGGEDLLRGLLDTLAIAILGTFISALLCVPFAFWAASNRSKWNVISGSGKFVLSFIRVFPEIIMALLFIKAVGPGSFAGVLALGIHSIGMLGKLISEDIERLDFGPSEALIASGANPIKTLWFAVLPQVLPSYLSFIIYRFEINIRSATILGIIGAGGIGTPLIFALSVRDWERVGVILLGIILMVILTDFISGKLRERLT
ncbi:phosphonate ABC transporter, permease protein PhnE [Massilibacterium senegalense]|uniref:phosphonate ABC transporter, permease protein PhnE n=1 Tax=Massilibacterium senegalense TaxID=1632858 RepID=UPI000785A0F7